MLNLGGDGTPQSNQFFGNFPNGFGYQPMPGVHPSQMGMFDQQGQMASYQQGSSNGGQQQDPNGLGFDFNFSNGVILQHNIVE